MNWIQQTGFVFCMASAIGGVGWAYVGKPAVAATVSILGTMIGLLAFVIGGEME